MRAPTAKELGTYLTHWVAWLLKPKTWGIAGIFILSMAVFVKGPGDPEARMRWLGMAWQLLGTWFVLRGLTGRHRLFSIPNPREAFLEWLREQPRFRGSQVITPKGAHAFASGGAVVSGVAKVDRDRSLLSDRQRLEELERWQVRVDERLGDVDRRNRLLDQQMKQLEETTGQKISEVSAAIRKVVQEAVAGDLILEWYGLLLLVLGTIAGGAATEWAAWLTDGLGLMGVRVHLGSG